ncbi:MAG: methyltransferase type 11, partial [Nitrososphaerota archaeon]
MFEKSNEIKEGIISCLSCNNRYPIISKIPILWSDFTSYLSNRAQLGGYLMNQAKNPTLKSFVKNSLKKINRQ